MNFHETKTFTISFAALQRAFKKARKNMEKPKKSLKIPENLSKLPAYFNPKLVLKRCKLPKYLKKRLKKRAKESGSGLKCSECPESFEDSKALRKHKQKKHLFELLTGHSRTAEEPEDEFESEDKPRELPDFLREHDYCIPGEEPKWFPYPCRLCKRGFNTSILLQRHMNIMHDAFRQNTKKKNPKIAVVQEECVTNEATESVTDSVTEESEDTPSVSNR